MIKFIHLSDFHMQTDIINISQENILNSLVKYIRKLCQYEPMFCFL